MNRRIIFSYKKNSIKSLYDTFQSYAKVGRLVGLSKQRIHQILKEYHNYGRKGRKVYNEVWTPKCKICFGFTELLHHKDFNNKNDSSVNLQPLCSRCHRLIHKIHLRDISQKQCSNCKRYFDKDIKSYHLKKGLCNICFQIKQGKKAGRNLFYTKNCIDCGKSLSKYKRNKGRCIKCRAILEYKIPKRREYHLNYNKEKYLNPIYRFHHLEICKQNYIKRNLPIDFLK